MLALSSTGEAAAAAARARRVTFSAYTLHPGAMLAALESAARGGARVSVRLDDDPVGSLRGDNRRAVAALVRAGADARLEPRVHAKVLQADGARFFDGRNWEAGDVVVRDRGETDVARNKADALRREAALLRGADVAIETETLGDGNPVVRALERLARAGERPRILVSARALRANARERGALERLARDGARIRVCEDSEKFALAGNRVWLGSANATDVDHVPPMTDWGVVASGPAVVQVVRRRFEAAWANARPSFAGPRESTAC